MAASPTSLLPVGDENPGDQETAGTSMESTLSSSEKNSLHGLDRINSVEHAIPVVDTTQDADEKQSPPTLVEPDPNIVDWDGPNDHEKALNWTNKKKWGNIAIISTVTLLTPLASSMVAPATPLIMRDLHFSDATVASFVVSIYILGYALGPLFIAPLSEVYGRLPVYHVCNGQFILWTIACALAPNIGTLLFFRLMAGIAGSCPLTIGGGSIADLIVQEKRGGAMALFALGPLLGPVIGPVAGGYLAEAAGWAWIFWLISIAVSSYS